MFASLVSILSIKNQLRVAADVYGRSLGARRCILFTALNLVNSGTYSKLTLEFSRPYQRAGVLAARRMMY